MWPTLVKIGSFEITTFGLMMFVGFLVGGWILTKEFRRLGLSDDDASNAVLVGAVGGILGAKIYYAILYRDFDSIFSRAGLVWYGGFIGGTLAVMALIAIRKLPFFKVADGAAPAVAMGYALGRIGCFLVGDDYGRPTDSWVGIAFPKGAPPTTADSLREFGVRVDPTLPADTLLRVHPTQLYEAGAAFVIFFILMRIARRTHAAGVVFGWFLLLAGIERFLVEFVRAKDDRFLGPFTVAQLISAVLIALGIALIVARRKRAAATV